MVYLSFRSWGKTFSPHTNKQKLKTNILSYVVCFGQQHFVLLEENVWAWNCCFSFLVRAYWIALLLRFVVQICSSAILLDILSPLKLSGTEPHTVGHFYSASFDQKPRYFLSTYITDKFWLLKNLFWGEAPAVWHGQKPERNWCLWYIQQKKWDALDSYICEWDVQGWG